MFLRILRNFSEQFFHKTPGDGCFYPDSFIHSAFVFICFLIFWSMLSSFLNTSFFLLETCVNLSVHCRRLKESSCRSSYVRRRCPVLCGQCNTSTMKPSTTKPVVSRGMYRSSQRRCSKEKGVLKNFAKFTGKNLCQRLFFNKVAGQ